MLLWLAIIVLDIPRTFQIDRLVPIFFFIDHSTLVTLKLVTIVIDSRAATWFMNTVDKNGFKYFRNYSLTKGENPMIHNQALTPIQ